MVIFASSLSVACSTTKKTAVKRNHNVYFDLILFTHFDIVSENHAINRFRCITSKDLRNY